MEDRSSPSAERADLAKRALLSLTSRERLVYIWSKAGFSDQEIANHLGTSAAAVETLFTEARRKIRLIMTPDQLR